jgi:hypothetical protein
VTEAYFTPPRFVKGLDLIGDHMPPTISYEGPRAPKQRPPNRLPSVAEVLIGLAAGSIFSVVIWGYFLHGKTPNDSGLLMWGMFFLKILIGVTLMAIPRTKYFGGGLLISIFFGCLVFASITCGN